MSRAPHPLLRPLWREAGAAARTMAALTAAERRLDAFDCDLANDPLLRLAALAGLLSPEHGDALLEGALSRLAIPEAGARREPSPMAAQPAAAPATAPGAPDVPPDRGMTVERRTLVEQTIVASRPRRSDPPMRLHRTADRLRALPLVSRPRSEVSTVGAAQVVGRALPAVIIREIERLLAGGAHVPAREGAVTRRAGAGSQSLDVAWTGRLERSLERVASSRRLQAPPGTGSPDVRDVRSTALVHPPSVRPAEGAPQQPGLARLAARFARGDPGRSRTSGRGEAGSGPAGVASQRGEPGADQPEPPSEAIRRASETDSEEDLAVRLAEVLRRDALRQGVMLSRGGP